MSISIAPVPPEGRFHSIAESVAWRQKYPEQMAKHKKNLREYGIYARNGDVKFMSWYADILMDDGQDVEAITWFMTALRYESEIARDIIDTEISRLGCYWDRVVSETNVKMVFGVLSRALAGDSEAQLYVWESLCRLEADAKRRIVVIDSDAILGIFSTYLKISYLPINGCVELSSFAPLPNAKFLSVADSIAETRRRRFYVSPDAREELAQLEREKKQSNIKAQNKFSQDIANDKNQVAILSAQNKICCICNRRIGNPSFSKLYEMCSPKRIVGDEQKFEVVSVFAPRCEICVAEEARKESRRKVRDEEIEVQISRFERNGRYGCIGGFVMLVLCLLAWSCNWVLGILTSIMVIFLLIRICKAKAPQRHCYPQDIMAYDEHRDWDYPPIKYLLDKGYTFGRIPPEVRY